jgi:dihydrofolate reductase
MIISLIVVVDEKNGIGKNNQLLCHLPADLKYFKQTTTAHHIVLGRKTYESVGKPLPNRTNIVITRSSKNIEGCIIKESIEDAIAFAKANNENELFITGGGTVYDLTLQLADRIYITQVHHTFDADTFFPHFDKQDWLEIKNEFHKADEKNQFDFSFIVYQRKIVM